MGLFVLQLGEVGDRLQAHMVLMSQVNLRSFEKVGLSSVAHDFLNSILFRGLLALPILL